MAILDNNELKQGMNRLARDSAVVTWQKSHIKTAFQAIEDWFEANKGGAGSAIETAAPGKFTNAQKKKIGGIWMLRKANREML